MTERERLEKAIAALEAQRAELGDAVVDSAQATLREKLGGLAQAADERQSTRESERRIVTVLFCDVVGSTAMAEQMDPEVWTGIMNAAFGRLLKPIHRYGGTVARLLGDAVLAFFGAPLAHENDPERACRAALDMIAATQDYAAYLETERGLSGFNVRVGINTGLVVIGDVGSDAASEYTAMGDAVNVAARLQSTAAPGAVLIGEDTYRPVAGMAQVEPLGPVRMKGKGEPLPVYRLIGLTGQPRSARGATVQEIGSALVGRDAALATLVGYMDRLMLGLGGLVWVIGEAGLGKSRLLAELRRSTMANGRPPVTWLEGQPLSYGQTITYWPFRQILWKDAGISEEDGEAEAWRKLDRRVQELFAEQTAEILPYLAALLSLEARGEYAERLRFLDGESMRQQIFRASRRFFERLAQEAPLVLVFEDLHWVDESSALLLEHLLPLVERASILICGLSRPDVDSLAARLRQFALLSLAEQQAELVLKPLSGEDSQRMLANLTPIERLSPRVQQLIVSKAEGNPFFLEEIIRALVGDGSIVRDPSTDQWQPGKRIEAITIPDTVQGVIVARLDRLPNDVKGVLRAAAVIGRRFLFSVLARVVDDDRVLDRQLNALQEAEFIRVQQQLPELEYIFKHALAQEAIYESLLLERRRALHDRVGRTIEQLFAGRLEEFYGLLAYHYARAEKWTEAQGYLLKAGDQAIALAADGEALSYYRQAMKSYASSGQASWGSLERATLERKMGVAQSYRGEREQAAESLQRALNHMGDRLPTSTWAIRLALVGEILRQIAHRLLPRLFVAGVYRPPTPELAEEIRIYEGLAWIDIASNPERMLLVTLRVLNRSERYGEAWSVASSSMALAFTMTIMPLRRFPLGYFHRALALAEQENMQDVVGLVHHGLAWYEAFQGRWAEALALSQRAVEITQVPGKLFNWAFPRFQVATILTYQGRYEQAAPYCHQLINFGREGAAAQVLCWGLASLGFLRWHQGRFEAAAAASEEAAALARTVLDQGFLVSAEADLGRSLVRQGSLADGLAALEASRASYQDFLGPDSYASLRNGLAEAHLEAAEQDYLGRRADWMKKARASCRLALKLNRHFVPAGPEAMRLQGTFRWLEGEPVKAQAWWARSLAEAEALGQPYDTGRTHLEMGRRLAQSEHLDLAATIFEQIGAAHDLALVRAAATELGSPLISQQA